VIRYDNRDTGLSVSYPPGEPGYALSDLVLDWRSASITRIGCCR
jgi:hypothetical protein